jgi:hypothetical protein
MAPLQSLHGIAVTSLVPPLLIETYFKSGEQMADIVLEYAY